MFHTILVPLDGSELAEHALLCAESLAAASSAELIVLRVVPFDILQPPEDDFALIDESKAYLARVASGEAARGRAVKTVTKWGQPARCILEEVRPQRADLVVIGSHGRSAVGRLLYGSVADAVLRGSPVPVVVVSPAVATARPVERILVALDGSTLAKAALAPAVDLAKALRAELVVLEVVPLPPYSAYDDSALLAAFDPVKDVAESEAYLASVARELREQGVSARTQVEVAKPDVAIAEIAAQQEAGLIAMATHGRSGLARLVLGSVATGTLQRTSVPLLLVGPAAHTSEAGQPQLVSAAARSR